MHRFVIEGKEFQVEVGARTGSTVQVTVNGKPYTVEVASPGTAVTPAAEVSASPRTPGPAAPLATSQASGGDAPGEVRAPIPGVVLSVAVSVGQTVTANTKLLVLEAMKMENEIHAGVNGVVAKVLVQVHQEVAQGDLLVVITPS